MTPKERAVAALNLQTPDKVPTFELEFQLEEEMFGRKFITEDLEPEKLVKLSLKEKEAKLFELAEYMVHVYGTLEYSIIPGYGPYRKLFCEDGSLPLETRLLHKYLKELLDDRAMIGFEGDGTFAIPDGNNIYTFSYAIADDPEGVKEKAKKMADKAIERNKRLRESGVECLLLCSDYCYNSGPFLSPAMFEEYIQPYLYRIIDEARKEGLYVIKHTDGNIMPILNQLVECKPHALHSIDPMAGVDIREVKELVGHKVCLCGNVNCSVLQTGTEEEIVKSAEYCLTHGKTGGGYIFSSSNCIFSGINPESYRVMLSVWKEMRDY